MKREEIFNGIKEAMKAKDSVRLDALRFVWSRIKEVEIDKKAELNDEEILTLITKEVKSRKEAIEQFRGAGRNDLVMEEEAKLAVLTAFLPQMMSEAEVEKVVEEILAIGESDFGKVMGMVMGKLKGKADGSVVQKVVKTKIS